MTPHLTYADRGLFLQTFDTLRSSWQGSDAQLLEDACSWIKSLAPNLGFEHALTRDALVLSRYLLELKDDRDLADIARGGLLYLLNASSQSKARLGDFGLLDDAFVSSYAVHEIRTRLGDVATYNPPRLTRIEQQKAEKLFLELLEEPQVDDAELIMRAKGVGDSLGNLAASGLFRRLQKNIEYLGSALQDASRNAEQLSYARAALGYLIREDDAIDDRLGIVGYLDDNFIAQMAVDLIEPSREPWLELLDATVGAWPFLNGLIFSDGDHVRSVSEFMIINSALACDDVRAGSDVKDSLLVVPLGGPAPVLLGFVAALGLIQKSGQREVHEGSFSVGQKVLVDYSAIAEFDGYEDINGRRVFALKQYYTEKGQRLGRRLLWPMSDLRRLVPANAERAVRGGLTYDLNRNDAMLPALEYLFNASRSAELSGVTKEIVIATSIVAAHEIANQLRLHGHALKEVIPMGHLSSDGVIPWSTSFGRRRPLLVFASDLDLACAYCEERAERTQLVIVDTTGRNAGKPASLQRLRHFGIPTLVVSSERTAHEVDVSDGQIGVMEWGDKDLSSLLWPSANRTGTGALSRYERRLESRTSSAPIVDGIHFDFANKAYDALRRLNTLAIQRHEEPLAELDELISTAYGLLSRLFRSATVLSPSMPSTAAINVGLHELRNILANSRYFTAQEREGGEAALQSLHELFSALKVENLKATFISDLFSKHPALTLICPDARLFPDLVLAYGTLGTRILPAFADDGDLIEGAVVPGWFRKDRMATLLSPPITTPIHLILYDVEQQWYAAFRHHRQESHANRSLRGSRARLFPGVPGWTKSQPSQTDSSTTPHEEHAQEIESLQQYIRAGNRQRIYKAAASDGTEAEIPARLVVFEGGAHAFLTESYRANVVTHLLDGTISELDANADVRQKTVSQMSIAEALLFHRGSDRDVIRSTADTILPPGVRKTSSIWRKALLEYCSRTGATTEQLHRLMKDAGCPLLHPTIAHWLESDNTIAPQAYKRDVGVIAKVTNDQSLLANFDNVLASIGEVRGAHVKASYMLAKRVVAKAVSILKAQDELSTLIELESNVVIARVLEIDDHVTPVRQSLVNRLVEGETWHE